MQSLKVIIKNVSDFGTINIQGIHQVLENKRDIDNAAYNADRDGFTTIIFYVTYPSNWMVNTDFRTMIRTARNLIEMGE